LSKRNDATSHLAAAQEVNEVLERLDLQLRALEHFCAENEIALLVGCSLYDRIDQTETLRTRWTGAATTLTGIARGLTQIALVELGEVLEDADEAMSEDDEDDGSDYETGGGVP